MLTTIFKIIEVWWNHVKTTKKFKQLSFSRTSERLVFSSTSERLVEVCLGLGHAKIIGEHIFLWRRLHNDDQQKQKIYHTITLMSNFNKKLTNRGDISVSCNFFNLIRVSSNFFFLYIRLSSNYLTYIYKTKMDSRKIKQEVSLIDNNIYGTDWYRMENIKGRGYRPVKINHFAMINIFQTKHATLWNSWSKKGVIIKDTIDNSVSWKRVEMS